MSECVYICVVLVKVLMGNRWHTQIIWVGKHRGSTRVVQLPGASNSKGAVTNPRPVNEGIRGGCDYWNLEGESKEKPTTLREALSFVEET